MPCRTRHLGHALGTSVRMLASFMLCWIFAAPSPAVEIRVPKQSTYTESAVWITRSDGAILAGSPVMSPTTPPTLEFVVPVDLAGYPYMIHVAVANSTFPCPDPLHHPEQCRPEQIAAGPLGVDRTPTAELAYNAPTMKQGAGWCEIEVPTWPTGAMAAAEVWWPHRDPAAPLQWWGWFTSSAAPIPAGSVVWVEPEGHPVAVTVALTEVGFSGRYVQQVCGTLPWVIFTDGFESGHTGAWSGVVGSLYPE